MVFRRLKCSLALIGISFFLSLPSTAQPIIYVNHAATGADNGASWTDAYAFLQDALQASQSGDELWVAAGTYKPDQGTGIVPGDREASFEIPGGLSVYGGFSGSEFSRTERDWNANETILSGDLVGNDDELLSVDNPLRLDNSFHIVRLEHSTGPIVLDGFTIQDGMGIGSGSYGGGGIRVRSPSVYVFDFPFFRISNCRFTRNVASSGIVSISANPEEFEPTITIEDSIFEQNLGACASVIAGTTLIRNVLFADNESNGHSVLSVGLTSVYVSGSTIRNNRTTGSLGVVYVGGADEEDDAFLYIWDSIISGNEGTCCGAGIGVKEAELFSINNIFSGNSVLYEGGSAIYALESKVHLINNVFAFNSALDGGAVESFMSTVSIANSIFWENTSQNNPDFSSVGPNTSTITVSHSLVRDPFPSFVTDLGGNVEGDPLFADADGPDNIPGTIDDDFRLVTVSPAVDAGANDSLFSDLWDLDGDGDYDELWPLDFLNNMRIFDGGSGTATVDMGAFEYDAPPVFTAVQTLVDIPNNPTLLGNYPNPFNPSTTIIFALPHPADVRLEVFDLLGKRVRLLESGFKPSGGHEVTFDASSLSSGVYFYTLTVGDFSQTRKMVVVK